MSDALHIRSVMKRYGGVTAVDDVTFDVEPGDVMGVVGPNGAGKSTLVDIISGFALATSGTVSLGAVQLTGRPPHSIARLGVARTFQHTSLFLENTVRTNLHIASIAANTTDASPAREIDAVLEISDLRDVADVLAASLPYGAQRRLAVAIALMSNPRVLLLDEPAAGMNPVESAEFVSFVREIHESRTIVLIEHDMSVVRALCERTAVLVDGTLLATGATDEVLADPQVVEVYLGAPL